MIHEFDETHQAETRDPLVAGAHSFDWETLYARLDADARSEANDKGLAEIVTRLLHLLLPPPGQPMNPRRVGLHVIALAWVLSPGYFDGNPSLRQLARRCRISPTTLGELTGKMSRAINWRNRAQQRGWNWHRTERRRLGKSNDDESIQHKSG